MAVFRSLPRDLRWGQTEPRGLNFTRYYSSERINYNPAGMAPGWLHNYYCNATPISDPEGGLGTATVQQMAPMIVATYAAIESVQRCHARPEELDRDGAHRQMGD